MTILIYGGTGGVGSALARKLAGQGHALHLVARDAGKLEALAAELGAGFTQGDVLDDALFERVAQAVPGPISGLAYAVGSITLKPLARLSRTEMLADFALNASGAALALRAAVPGLKAAEGTPGVVLFSSVAVAQGFNAHVSIGMAKGAVEGLTLSAAAELAPKIRINCIAPSLTRTPLAHALTANEQVAQGIAQLHALQRLGTPEDIAALAVFLLSGEAGWITGQVMGVDGGRATLRTKG